jgi:TetR/AcrR family transcriptional repressor of lmrAB and yxaGH operons
LIDNAIAMVQERGVHATGLSDLLKRSATARNSIYQHFPGGKTELMVAVTEVVGAKTAARIDDLAQHTDPFGVVRGIIAYWLDDMRRTDFGTGCAIAAASLA